jgi:hypothetical protein
LGETVWHELGHAYYFAKFSDTTNPQDTAQTAIDWENADRWLGVDRGERLVH